MMLQTMNCQDTLRTTPRTIETRKAVFAYVSTVVELDPGVDRGGDSILCAIEVLVRLHGVVKCAAAVRLPDAFCAPLFHQLVVEIVVRSVYTKTPLFFEFSLCLSRACLGKIMHFIYKWRKNGVFSPAMPFSA